MLDSTKAAKGVSKGEIDGLDEEDRQVIEQAEDEFVGQTEEAVGVMKNASIPRDPELSRRILANNIYRSLIPLSLYETWRT